MDLKSPQRVCADNILVMISYDIDIGFAIGRLISIFYEMGLQITGNPDAVHFSFGRIAGKTSPSLPPDFCNVLEFDYRTKDQRDIDRLHRYIRQHRIGVLFGLDVPVQSACLKAARKAGVHTVVSYWGAPMSSIMPPLKLAFKRLEVKYAHPWRPNYFIFESEAMRTLAIRGRGLPRSSTAVIPTGVDVDKFQHNADAPPIVYERFGIPEHKKIVVYMGHLHERKGVHVLMNAAANWGNAMGRSDIHCLFLGNLEHEISNFQHLADEAAEFITFGGYQTDIPSLLAGCYVGCVPSTGWDSFPMASLEMQSCGLPVIVSDLQGVPETIEDGVTGWVVQAGDSAALAKRIVYLVDHPGQRSHMSIAARRRIEEGYSRTHQIDNLVRFLHKAISSRN